LPAAATATDGVWHYVTTTALRSTGPVLIEVTATDRPGRKTAQAPPHA
jgi:hypothetical protein